MSLNILIWIAVLHSQTSMSVTHLKQSSSPAPDPRNTRDKATVNSDGTKVYGIYDDIPEEGKFKVTNEVEYFFKDHLNAKLRDLEELKTEIAVLDRHLRKHSEVSNFQETNDVLKDIDAKVIKPYEEGLKVLKEEVTKASHDSWSAATVVMINTVVDKAESFLEMSREKLDKALDDHVASEEHKKEHNHAGDAHDGHDEDHLNDYADLITDDDDVDVSARDEDLLIEYMDMEIEDLENIIKKKDDLEHHIVEHFKLENVDPDELQLKVAENVLEMIDLEKLNSYEKSLQDLKRQLRQSNGKVKLEIVDKITETMKNAENLFETFQENIKIAETFDEEFEEFEAAEKLAKVSKPVSENHEEKEIPNFKFTFDIVYPEETTLKDVQQVTNDIEGDGELSVSQEIEEGSVDSKSVKLGFIEHELIGKLFSFPFSAVLVLFTLVVLVAMMVTVIYRAAYKSKDKSCEMGQTPSDRAGLVSRNQRSPELEMVKEDDGWTSSTWGKSWAATPNRRKRK